MRPSIEPSKSGLTRSRASAGSSQLLVGPSSCSVAEQMNVRSSALATSPGSDSARYEFGRLASDSLLERASVDELLAEAVVLRRRNRAHQWISSGSVRNATSSTHASRRSFVVGAEAVVFS